MTTTHLITGVLFLLAVDIAGDWILDRTVRDNRTVGYTASQIEAVNALSADATSMTRKQAGQAVYLYGNSN